MTDTSRLVSDLVRTACTQERDPSEANQNAYRAARDAVEAALSQLQQQAEPGAIQHHAAMAISHLSAATKAWTECTGAEPSLSVAHRAMDEVCFEIQRLERAALGLQPAEPECPHCGGAGVHPSERDCYQQTPEPAWWIAKDPECKTPSWGLIAQVCDRKTIHYTVPLYASPSLREVALEKALREALAILKEMHGQAKPLVEAIFHITADSGRVEAMEIARTIQSRANDAGGLLIAALGEGK